MKLFEQLKEQLEQAMILMPHHLLTNFETQKYYQNEPKFNGVYSRDKLPKIYDGAYAANFDEYELLETHWKTVYVNVANVTHSDSFGVEHISKQLNKKIHRQQKYKYLQNTSIKFKNVLTHLFSIY